MKEVDASIEQAQNLASKIIDATEVKEITNQVNEKATTGSSKGGVKAKVYKDHSITMKHKKETIHGFVYFNQTDKEWNDNGYQIRHSGCGPTSMAVVITTLTGKWVTPVETTAWAYEHGYYSSNGSIHSVVNALSTEYGLKCEGVGRDKEKIKAALKEGNPVVCLMGPGYFTKGGHFMVLVDIDKEDHVTVADVASRTRSSYKYALDSIIAQSKNATSGGPFWVISGGSLPKSENTVWKREEVKLSYQIMQDNDMDAITKSLEKGNVIMALTDQKITGKADFIYMRGIDSQGMVTVMDTNYQNTRQCSVSFILEHLKNDATGICLWKVKGNHVNFLMPLTDTAL